MPSGHTSGLNRWGVAKRMMNGERRGIGECGRQAEYIAEKHRSCDSGVECIGASNNGENIVARHIVSEENVVRVEVFSFGQNRRAPEYDGTQP